MILKQTKNINYNVSKYQLILNNLRKLYRIEQHIILFDWLRLKLDSIKKIR